MKEKSVRKIKRKFQRQQIRRKDKIEDRHNNKRKI